MNSVRAKMNPGRYLAGVLFLAAALTMETHACDTGTVRDAAFYSARDTFWLGMVFDENDAESRERYKRMAAWLERQNTALNIQTEHILPDDAIYLRLRYGVAEPPEQLPATYLAGRHPAESRPVVFMTWDSAPEPDLLEGLRSNPALARITEEAPEHWGCVLYSPGNGARRGEIEAAAAQWQQNHAPGVSVIEVDRNDGENQFLCSVAGMDKSDDDWAGIVFGKGKLMMPVLVGQAITARELDRLLNRLMTPCTCIEQATVFGLNIPMFWEDEHNARHIELAAPVGYMEMTLDDKLAPLFAEMPSGRRSIKTSALAVFTALGLAAVFLLSVAFLRLRSR